MSGTNKFIFWAPRILLLIFALFLVLFSFDVFGNNYTFWQIIVGLFMHNLPSLILIFLLLISWKYELIGGIIFCFLGALCITGIIIVTFNVGEGGRFNPILIMGSIVFLLIGILFLVGWRQKRKK